MKRCLGSFGSVTDGEDGFLATIFSFLLSFLLQNSLFLSFMIRLMLQLLIFIYWNMHSELVFTVKHGSLWQQQLLVCMISVGGMLNFI